MRWGAIPAELTAPRATQLDCPSRDLTVDRLTERFGDRVAFQDVSFELGYGEVFGFLGPNGAGKTTTVRTLGTLIAPTSGSATVAGIPPTAANGVEIRQRIRAIFRKELREYRRNRSLVAGWLSSPWCLSRNLW